MTPHGDFDLAQLARHDQDSLLADAIVVGEMPVQRFMRQDGHAAR
ncbi:hypothetical protein [Bordetella sp. FB-8]|nr:hypothetical protein [Bordetella sp. FB-8]